jgi:hypothetical protein
MISVVRITQEILEITKRLLSFDTVQNAFIDIQKARRANKLKKIRGQQTQHIIRKIIS